tara:strand:+ start:1022 stop:1222 length:201 start_codon:yes stop_codon:yes gene_type:complete
MKLISLKYLEENFSEIVDRALDGETFLLDTPDGQIALVPDKNILKPVIDSGQAEDITHLWNHDDGA